MQRLINYGKTLIKKNRWGLCAIAIVWLIFFSRIIIGTHVYFLDDLKAIYYPLEHVYQEFQSAWQLPHWSNLFGFGQPLLAWGQLGFFTPLHVILRALQLHPLILLQVSVVTYFALGLLGMFIFLRRHSLSQFAAALGAIVYVFSGFNVGHLNHVNFYVVTMLLPWLLIAIDDLLKRPTPRRTAILALIAAAMILSGHPQITLYTFIAAGLIGTVQLFSIKHRQRSSPKLRQIVTYALLAGVLTLGLSSLFLLPLNEFLPITDRADGLSRAELYEFSYPPWHAITLVLPYFFGDHSSYWGAKNFQELAAFTGLIPLLLTGLALSRWDNLRRLRITGLLLIALGIVGALGLYSPFYRILIEHRILTSLSNPGRLVFFFCLGLSLLTAVGLEDIRTLTTRSSLHRLRSIVFSLLLPAAFLAPFFWYLAYNPHAYWRWLQLARPSHLPTLLAVIGLAVYLIVLLYNPHRSTRWRQLALIVMTAITLLVLGWNYNPVIPRQIALRQPPFSEALAQHQQRTGVPARLYSREEIMVTTEPGRLLPTSKISPTFSLHQPVTLTPGTSACFTIPMHASASRGQITVSLRDQPTILPRQAIIITAIDILNQSDQLVCFTTETNNQAWSGYLSFTSNQTSNINLYIQGQPEEKSVYLVRVTDPTPTQLQQSNKYARLEFTTEPQLTIESDLAMLTRHLQVTVAGSSARWASALAILSYRQFVEQLFADDRAMIDGDGTHFLDRQRTLLNMSGITHLIQLIPAGAEDNLPARGFKQIDAVSVGTDDARLYTNPEAYPKAYLADQALYQNDSDHVRAVIQDADYNPRQLVYINRPLPTTPTDTTPDSAPPKAGTTITRYNSTAVDVEVTTPTSTWLVLTDTQTPQWQTFIDNKRIANYTANTVFRAAPVPPGKHIVSFRYHSPASERAKWVTAASLALTFLLLAWPLLNKRTRRREV